MKYELFEDFNDGSYLNESSTDVETFLNLMEIPIPQVIPSDGSFSDPSIVVKESPCSEDEFFDSMIKRTEYVCKVRYCNEDGPNEPRALLNIVTNITFSDGDIKPIEMTLALIENKWYYYDYD